VLLLVNVAVSAMGPAAAASVADVLAAQAALTVPPGMSDTGWRAWRAAHEAELQRAHTVLMLAHAVEETVIATQQAAFAQRRTTFICNYEEESRPEFATLVDRFVADGARQHGLPEADARPRLLQTDITEMLPLALLSYYRCPAAN
jgi:hypothetical protein